MMRYAALTHPTVTGFSDYGLCLCSEKFRQLTDFDLCSFLKFIFRFAVVYSNSLSLACLLLHRFTFCISPLVISL
jgi:hypothetical protein